MSVERFKLTKTFVDNLDFSPEKQVFYKDAELVGFALRVTKVKSYIVKKNYLVVSPVELLSANMECGLLLKQERLLENIY